MTKFLERYIAEDIAVDVAGNLEVIIKLITLDNNNYNNNISNLHIIIKAREDIYKELIFNNNNNNLVNF
jgi:hypothetical protein